MWSFKKAEFQALPIKEENSQSDDSSESEAMLDHDYRKYDSRSRLRQACSSNIPWIFTTAALSLYILIFASGPHAMGVPWTSTDVVYIRNLMKESTTRFTSGLDYNNSNHSLQHTPSEGLRFIGTPNRELDSAWDEIAGTQETFLTKEEATSMLVEDTYISPLTGLPVVEIESFHHLHCLNYIRKTIDIEYYPDIQRQETRRTHVEHCINSIREFIMCKADMTPIVLVPPEKAGVPVPVPEFRTRHVCRNFEEMASWVRRERNADLSDEESLEIARRIRKNTGTKY